MEYINRIELQGIVGSVRSNIVQDIPVQNFSVCTEYVAKLDDGATRCELTWHSIVAWDKLEVAKGDYVRVTGRLRTTKYTSASGEEKIFYEVIASEIKLLPLQYED